jgi:ABC-type bacteriocin/lantibiotic exporter with double-glycine peptidase domain
MTIIKFYNSFVKIFSKKQKKEIYVLFFLSIIAMILETLGIASIFPLLDYIFKGPLENEGYFFLNNNFLSIKSENILLFFILLFILIFFLKAIYLTFFSHKKNKFVYDIRTYQTNNLFKSYLYEDYFFHIKNNTATLTRNLNDANLLSVFARSVVELFAEIIMFLGILTFLIIISPAATISLTIFFGLIGIIFYKTVQSKASKWGLEAQNYRGLKFKNMNESFGSIKDIKIMGKELNFLNIFSKNNFQENYFTKKHSFIVSLPKIWFEWLAVLALIIALFYLTKNIKNNSEIIPILGVFALAAYKLIPSITKMGNYLQDMKFCLPAVRPYMKSSLHINFNNSSLLEKEKSVKLVFKNKIAIENLTYKFPDTEKNILADLDLEITKGQCVGIHGESGAGKTTLINLILGLLKPTSGKISIDNFNVVNNTQNWQSLISYIPQNVFITDDKIVNNVALGETPEQINLEKINSSMNTSRIYDFVSSLPEGVHTNCGELGEKLSGGQRQRIGIARALYRNSEVLIFDEFTNFLDTINEKNILNEIKQMTNKTRIIVSHNLEVLKYCDVVYELKNCKIRKSDLKINEK